MPLPHRLALVNRRVTNRVVGAVAGWAPGFAIVVHKGRKSGREYRTPVNVFHREDGYRFALTYGTESDWVKNVLAEGGCTIETQGKTVELVDPVIMRGDPAGWAPLVVRQVLRGIDAADYLQATVRS
ncbi:nitroreductase family deazaflavin-dependent oxidoreductase [Antrihabitans cavernicola]|uniref:Nitroreductase family deazaflavin-dependent oxidoreductase n=1 Tax=Antrihabitans cavernicola TaxID=2495913 RepID=A0A5A7SDP0_9NOCA|nr:nitroreductase family deazaflavin-dependent oxidoreductase [Spelaeibacter cavernicola]KAA0023654.1 nitroreductase family deazaflavin-dependent oxidoreductase [Spelaeibacter cavernicola]